MTKPQMMLKWAHYLMIERKYGDQPSSWYPAWEAATFDEAQDAHDTMPAMYGEVSRVIVSGPASGDCCEMRPC